MRFDVITIFPKMFSSYFEESIVAKALRKKIFTLKIHNLRETGIGKHKKVDDKPFGGGPGMVLMVEPIFRMLKKIKALNKKKNEKQRIILTSVRGKQFKAADARRLARYKRIIFICGRYEGVDERVAKYLADEEFSIGPYFLTGGELPAMVMIDAIIRHLPNVLGKEESLEEKRGSFPQYTRPREFMGWKVPKVLLSGDHKKIEAWRQKHSQKFF